MNSIHFLGRGEVLALRCVSLGMLGLALAAAPGVAQAADVTNPAEVTELRANRNGTDVDFTWDPTILDAAGQPETVDLYRVYRGEVPDFVPDKDGGSNVIGTPTSESFTDAGAGIVGGPDFYYLVTAVDVAGNESISKTPTVTTPPVLSGQWTDTGIDLNWTDAQPSDQVSTYLVYYGRTSGQYEGVDDVGLVSAYSLTGLETNVNWYISVVAVDLNGNESAFSNEHVDPVGGTIDIRVHDESGLCWGAEKCTPIDPEHIQRSDGWQLLVPADFPEGDWTRVDVTFTIESRLCNPPAEGNTSKCGTGNPCVNPPCNGGYNTCGDPWDRTAHLFMVLDDCVEMGHGCMNHDNLELMRAVTPFGTDADPPNGTGVVPPRVLTLDITPYAPLLAGERRYIGGHIGHYVQSGWWITSDFHFSKRPEEASSKPPADGIEVLFFGGVPPPTDSVTVPPEASQVITRLFTTGHGAAKRCYGGDNHGNGCGSDADCPGGACGLTCDQGSNAGEPCLNSGHCPGGSCENCDEFCHKTNQIIVDSVPVWQNVPWRDCCYPRDDAFCVTLGFGGPGCQAWNACGFPSCSYRRAGWCPGEIACHYDLDQGCDQDMDMTSHFAPGGTYAVDYDVLIRRGSWSISLVLYWYE
jgi:hypothetical protein